MDQVSFATDPPDHSFLEKTPFGRLARRPKHDIISYAIAQYVFRAPCKAPPKRGCEICEAGGALRVDDEAKHVLNCGVVAGVQL